MPKITELNAITNVANNDLMMVVHDPSGLPSTNKITVNNFITSVSSSIVDNTLALIPNANTTTYGKVKVGSGLSTNATGFLNTTLPTGGTAGQVLTKNATNQYVWSNFTGLDKFLFFNSSNNYTATADDYLILCDPVNIPGDITISLPMDVPDGKRYLIKNMNTGVNNDLKVKVTTTSGEYNYIESPVTQQFVAYHDIVNLNDAEEWVFDSTYGYRHLGSTTNSPIFSLDANTYLQVAIKNRSTGNNASSDLVLYNDSGEILADSGPYIDIGINSSNYDIPEYNIGGASDSYIYNKGGDLTIGTANTGTSIKFHTDGTTAESLRFTINSTATYISNGNLIVPNYSSIITPIVANTSYAETYFGGSYWGGYTQLDVVGGNSSWAWIETNLQNVNNPYVLIENKSDNGSSYTWTFESDGTLTIPGGFNLPTKSMTGWNWNYGLTGPTLQLSNNETNEVIVTGPTPTSSYANSQRIIIQGQRGYGVWGQNTAGEGGDIYIWAGVGGESDTNVGGSGGDIKVRGGQGQDNQGGYVKIEGGDAAFWNGTAVGDGGFIEITAGDVIESGGDANNHGGNITITAGKARYDSTKSGVITLRVGNNVNNTGTQYSTVFNTDGTITLSANGDIKNTDGVSVIKSIPQNLQSSLANYTLTLSDAGKHIYKNDGDGYGVEVPTNASVPFEIGTTITVVSGDSWTYIYPVDGMTTEVWGAGYNQTSTAFYIPNNSMATLLKIGTDKWMLSGAGLAID